MRKEGSQPGPTVSEVKHTFWINPEDGSLVREEERRHIDVTRILSNGQPKVFEAY